MGRHVTKIGSLRGTMIIGEISPRYVKPEESEELIEYVGSSYMVDYIKDGKFLWPLDASTGDAYIISEDADKIPVEEGIIFPDINAKKGDLYVCKGVIYNEDINGYPFKNFEKVCNINYSNSSYNEERRSVCFQYNETDESYNEAQSDYSFVIGYNNKAIREETDENGLTLQSANSFVGGMNNRAYHSNSIVFGEGLYTQFGNTFVLGKYNGTVSNHDGWGDTVLGIVGDGYKDSAGNVTGRNVLLLQGGSDPALHCRGGFKNNASWINDFGEYFEWLDGNPDNEDRIGYMVQLNGDKIELATSLKKCIGVISGTTGFIGGVCAFEWHNKFLHDKWGREIIGEDGNPVINPDYDADLEYIPRELRKEWDVVGLVGQVITRQDGTLEVGGYAGCSNGIATNATRGFKVLKIIDNETALLLVK